MGWVNVGQTFFIVVCLLYVSHPFLKRERHVDRVALLIYYTKYPTGCSFSIPGGGGDRYGNESTLFQRIAPKKTPGAVQSHGRTLWNLQRGTRANPL